jgi:putative transposase
LSPSGGAEVFTIATSGEPHDQRTGEFSGGTSTIGGRREGGLGFRIVREAFPADAALPFLVYDRDSIFSADVTTAIRNLGIERIRTAYRSFWQNPFAEQWLGTCRRELLDNMIVLGERHLRRLLADYVAYYNVERVHTGLGDSPKGRPSEARPSPSAKVVALPRVGGLHHQYAWCKAA